MTQPESPMTFLQAIARMEGFYVVGTRPNRLNNPGDIEFRPWTTKFGAVIEKTQPGVEPRFASFPSAEHGFAAMKCLFAFPLYKGKTVSEALNQWAPPVENATNRYIINICSWVPCQPTDCIDPLVEAS